MAFLSQEELVALGFKHLGRNVLISDKASIYGAANISIGDFSRIDDFCILSAGAGGIKLGRNVHIACFVSLIGHAAIEVQDFAGLSGRVAVYSSSDNFSGSVLTGPTVSSEYTDVKHKAVHIGRHVIIGAGTIILPGVTLQEGVSIGALSLVNRNCEAFKIYVGSPVRYVKERKRDLLALEQEYLQAQRKDLGLVDLS
jgi:acetyltransferase-like isoleucine patch superfamily enzyme